MHIGASHGLSLKPQACVRAPSLARTPSVVLGPFLFRFFALVWSLLIFSLAALDTAAATEGGERIHATQAFRSPTPSLVSSSSSSSPPLTNWSQASLTPPPHCPVITSSVAQDVCSSSTSERVQKMRSARLLFCDLYPFIHLLPAKCEHLDQVSEQECMSCLNSLVQLDQNAAKMHCQLKLVLNHFECKINYSNHWSCPDCQVRIQKTKQINNKNHKKWHAKVK